MGIKSIPFLAPSLGLAMLFTIGTTAKGQNNQQMPSNPPAPNQPVSGQVGPAPQWTTPPDDITRREIADMNQFLDNHPDIAEHLRNDPSLIDNHTWVADRPDLQAYLQNHPRISEVFRAHPNLFMHDEERYQQQLDRINPRDMAEMNRFMDNHPEIAEQLRKEPTLVDNRVWVGKHPALQQYLQAHPQLADAFRAHPDQFMSDEEHYEHHEGQWNYGSYARVNQANDQRQGNDQRNDQRNRGELTGFGQFLGSHSNVAAELGKDPSLVNNQEYVASHPELDEYLKAHPAVSQQLAQNPQSVMSSEWVQQGGGMSMKSSTMPREKPNQ
jgi:hypothetical protein